MLKHNSKVILQQILSFSAIASIVAVLVLTLSGTEQPLSANSQAIAGEEVDHGGPPEAHFIGDSKSDAEQYVETLGLEMAEENIDKFLRGCAAITYMSKGQGEIFAAGTLDWVRGLEKRDPFIDRITRNVLDRFSA